MHQCNTATQHDRSVSVAKILVSRGRQGMLGWSSESCKTLGLEDEEDTEMSGFRVPLSPAQPAVLRGDVTLAVPGI